jgi:uncharacterized protein GlcG (DUF336 family)
MKILTVPKTILLSGVLAFTAGAALASEPIDLCPDAASRALIHQAVTAVLKDAQAKENGGFGFHMWAAVVNRAGQICAIARSGPDSDSQWPGSRVIAAQKANAANAFSLPGFALSTANLYEATQPGGGLYGLQFSNLLDTNIAYAGKASDYGTVNDPLVGKKPGGLIAFGGGLALYDNKQGLVGAVGVSGDSACADHNIAWRMRSLAKMDFVPAGPSPANNDQIIYKGETGKGKPGFEHLDCGHSEKLVAHKDLAPTQ